MKPDLLSFEDATAVTKERWAERRRQLAEAIVPHEYGGMPPKGQKTESVALATHLLKPDKRTGFNTYEVRTTFDNGRDLSFELRLWVPPGDGPFPVVLDGDGCWRYFNDEIVNAVVQRGNIAASFNRAAVAADNKDRYRETGLYRVFPDAAFGVVAAWAWGYHRCVDVLQSLPFVSGDQIAITGHSRGGKTALLAGATDERIAITNPNDSGTGGSGPNRVKCAGAEVVNDFFRSGNIFWFGEGFRRHRHRDGELPYDQHFLHAMVAPRALLVTEAYGDVWANPPGSYAACRDADRVYAILDADPYRLGWAIREGAHAHSAADYDALLDFVDLHFRGQDVVREFRRGLFPDLERVLRTADRPS